MKAALTKLLLAFVLLGVGLPYAAAHLCPPAATGAHMGAHSAAAAGVSGSGVSGSGVSGSGPSTACLAAIAAILIGFVLRLLSAAGSASGPAVRRDRPSRLPAVRGSPLLFSLSLQRVAVLRL